jgi:hypothetical protein
MRRIAVVVIASLAAASASLAQSTAPVRPRAGSSPGTGRPGPAPVSPDGASPDAIVKALYESVSHGPDGEPNWKRMRDIFLPVGMLVPPKRPQEDMFTVLDVDGFEDRTKKWMAEAKAKGQSTGFFETEVARRSDCFGNVCQLFSTYASRHAPGDDKPFMRGINSIQLVNDGHRWWIASVVWDSERADNPIPAQYDAGATVPDEYKKKN